MTLIGEITGKLYISPYSITFDPTLCSENKPFIPVNALHYL